MKTTLIFLAGGKGTRMGSPLPKQFLPLNDRAIALHSLAIFLQIEEIEEIIVVCAPAYRHFFAGMPVRFAPEGKERQDSVYNGFQLVDPNSEWICTHDSARPFITLEMVHKLFEEGKKQSAATVAMPVKYTLKEAQPGPTVTRTLDRSTIWEIQTPQLIKKNVMQKGFEHIHKHNLTVTDDVMLAELIGEPATLTLGSYKNIKITTPEDLSFAQWTVTNTVCASPMMEPATAAGKSSPIASLSKA